MDNIITDNLVIRKFTLDDVSAHFKNNNEQQIKNFMYNHWLCDVDTALKEIEGFLLDYEDMKKAEFHLAITINGIIIGHVGIGKSDINNDAYEICCAIGKDYRGLGYAAEATRAFAQWCKTELDIDKIYASTDTENIASCKTLINAGFCLTDIKIPDKNLSVYVF